MESGIDAGLGGGVDEIGREDQPVTRAHHDNQ
jgi:hypothetical protein